MSIFGASSWTPPSLRKAIDEAYGKGHLGKNILGVQGFNFDLHIHMGAGSYECGEESALMSSLMGERGQPDSSSRTPRSPSSKASGIRQRLSITLRLIHACRT